MKNFLNNVRSEAAKRALYRRTLREIASLSNREAIDLGIFPGDAEQIARQAVYG